MTSQKEYHYIDCYNKFRPISDVEGFTNCSYNQLLKDLKYPLHQSDVRMSPEYEVWRQDVYNFCVECCVSPRKYLKRLPITRPECGLGYGGLEVPGYEGSPGVYVPQEHIVWNDYQCGDGLLLVKRR